jgi:hypothetical protein
MSLTVQIEPASGAPPRVDYRWDTDTDILSAQLHAEGPDAPAGAVELQGEDGSWVILDLRAGKIRGIEIAVWPDVHKRPQLVPPSGDFVSVVVPPPASISTEVETPMSVEVDDPERIFHFRMSGSSGTRAVRLASDILLDVEPSGAVAGLWLLNVPPFPLDQ